MPEFSELLYSQVCCGCRKRKKTTNSTDVLEVKMTIFGYRVELIRVRHVIVKDEAKIARRGTDWDGIQEISLLTVAYLGDIGPWPPFGKKIVFSIEKNRKHGLASFV